MLEPSSLHRPSTPGPDLPAVFSTAREILEDYARRGVFFGLAEDQPAGSRREFRILWHYQRVLRLMLEPMAQRITLHDMLPGLRARDPLVRALRAYLKEFSNGALPAHRGLDRRLGVLRLVTSGGTVGLQVTVKGSEYAHCLRRLIHVSHEIYMVFLRDGPYWEYRVEHLGLDPEAWA